MVEEAQQLRARVLADLSRRRKILHAQIEQLRLEQAKLFGLASYSEFVLRRREPDTPRPYRAFGYPLVPALFVLVTVAILLNTFIATPHQALQSVVMLLAGLPFYLYWSRRAPPSDQH